MIPITRTLAEMTLVLATGLGLGLAANAASSDGLDLKRDYFPKSAPAAATVPAKPLNAVSESTAVPVVSTAATQESPTAESADAATDGTIDPAVLERLASKGLRAITFAETHALFLDPMYSYEAYVFIDARDDQHYAEGHIPGAHQFDHFRAERFQEQMMQIIPTAMNIVVYCNGGDCEDSESAALFLLGLGADPAHLAVYTGGITDWRERGMPVERGALNSGDLETSEETP